MSWKEEGLNREELIACVCWREGGREGGLGPVDEGAADCVRTCRTEEY